MQCLPNSKGNYVQSTFYNSNLQRTILDTQGLKVCHQGTILWETPQVCAAAK